MGPVRVRSLILSMFVALLALSVAAPGVSAAGDQLQDSAVATYELRPNKGVIHVTTVLTLTNKAPSKRTSRTCDGVILGPYGAYSYTYDCSYSTLYYYDYYRLWVEKDAKAIKVKANSGSASVKKEKVDGNFRRLKISYSNLFYGKTRKITLQYDLPAGGPRSSAARIATYAYTKFCGYGPSSDKGALRIVVPTGFQIAPSGMTKSTSGGKDVYQTKTVKNPWKKWACIEGRNPKGVVTEAVTQPDGTAVSVSAWKGDSKWSGSVQEALADLPSIAAVLGEIPSGKPLAIKEDLFGRVYDPITGEVTLATAVTDPDTARDALVGAWFDREHFLANWVREGYVRWAQVKAGVSDAECDDPGSPPSGTHDLGAWPVVEPATGLRSDQGEVNAWRAEAACYVVASAHEAIGPERSAAVLAALRSGTDVWGPEASRASLISGWQDWLDIVMELGFRPSGADSARLVELLADYGVAPSAERLRAHEAAREAYHALAARMDGSLPEPILVAMRRWDVEAATELLASATSALDTAATVSSILPSADPTNGVVTKAVAAATSLDDLEAAVATSEAQVAAAKTAAAAIDALAVPLDTVQAIGLLGGQLPDDTALLAAVAAADPGGARAAADEIAAALEGAREAGTQRVAIGLGTGFALLLAFVAAAFVVRRRRTASASASASASGEGGVGGWEAASDIVAASTAPDPSGADASPTEVITTAAPPPPPPSG